MRIVLPTAHAVMLCAALAGCGEQSAQSAQAASPAPNEAVLTRARTDNSATSAQLVAQAQAVTSPAWRETSRAWLVRTNQQAGLSPTPAQLEAQIDLYRYQVLVPILGAMETVGGPEVVAYCLALGENEAAPLPLRKAALAVLVRHVDRNDPAVRARSQAIWERVTTLGRVVGNISVGGSTLSGGAVSNASSVVAGMQAGFRRCYNKGLAEDVNMSGSVRVTAKIGPRGEVMSASPVSSGLSSTVVACVVTRVASAVFAPPEGGGATVVIPVTFVSKAAAPP